MTADYYVSNVWYLFETFELRGGYWHPLKELGRGVGSWPEGEQFHIFRAIGNQTNGHQRTRLTRVYPKNSKEFSELIQGESKIYKDGEENIFF